MTNSGVLEINGNPNDLYSEINGVQINAMEVEFRCGKRFPYELQNSTEAHATLVLDMIEPVHIKGQLRVLYIDYDDYARSLIPAIDDLTSDLDLHLILDGNISSCIINGTRIPLTSARVKQTVLDYAEVDLYYTRTGEFGKPIEYRITGTLHTPRDKDKEQC